MEKNNLEIAVQEVADAIVVLAKEVIKEVVKVVLAVWENMKSRIKEMIIEYEEKLIPVPRFMWTPIEWDTRRNSQVMSRKPLLVRRMNM